MTALTLSYSHEPSQAFGRQRRAIRAYAIPRNRTVDLLISDRIVREAPITLTARATYRMDADERMLLTQALLSSVKVKKVLSRP